ncbi:hypothetical protein [Secundilactobacillus kimchicus]|uniref:hypothetical protein n=1 Tax=Secundilactobacillus kimchicus TaxID=528209 RepID=UPI001DBFC817|nr:hypothetical protein [Secundilactobacillus kimchicus]MBT9672849.1 hypothetical protein [Secundilactobacillus kimchicus]
MRGLIQHDPRVLRAVAVVYNRWDEMAAQNPLTNDQIQLADIELAKTLVPYLKASQLPDFTDYAAVAAYIKSHDSQLSPGTIAKLKQLFQ